MANPIVDLVKGAFEPIRSLISEAVVDKDRANEISAQLYQTEAQIVTKALEYEGEMTKTQAGVVTAEAQGESWLQRNWRPITMLTFTALVVAKWLGYTVDTGITEAVEIELMHLIQIGLGGYVVGRSAEKIIPQVADIIKRK